MGNLSIGLNALSNNLIMADRKKLKNPNGLILGTPGSGKSFAAKREIPNVFIVTKDDIIICDPEGEYFPLVDVYKRQEKTERISGASPERRSDKKGSSAYSVCCLLYTSRCV